MNDSVSSQVYSFRPLNSLSFFLYNLTRTKTISSDIVDDKGIPWTNSVLPNLLSSLVLSSYAMNFRSELSSSPSISFSEILTSFLSSSSSSCYSRPVFISWRSARYSTIKKAVVNFFVSLLISNVKFSR